MAKPKEKRDDERSVDIDHLEPPLRKKAHDVGFRKRISINKVVRTIEHDERGKKLCLAFVVVTGIVAVIGIVGRFTFIPDERKGHFLMLGLFSAMWAVGSWAYMKRFERHVRWGNELLAVVKEKLGK